MSDSSDLADAVKRLENAAVLVVGDVMLDRFVYGAVERISPEAPIPVVRIQSQIAMLGGAGNVARNVAALGGQAHFIGVVGDDTAGLEVKRLFTELPRAVTKLIVDPRRKTAIKTRYIAAGQQMLRADDETVMAVDAIEGEIEDAIRASLVHVGAVVLADYGKGVFLGGVATTLIKLARARGIPVIVDPQGADYSRYAGASLVTPNRAELHLASGLPVGTDAETIAAASALTQRYKLDAVLATRSADGMTLIEGPKKFTHFPAEAREVFDVSGAGDTVVSALSSALAAGLSMDQAVRLANVTAGIVVAKVGTAVAYPDDVLDALRHSDGGAGGAKVKDLDRAMDLVRLWRRQGHKVGFANGCFDLLHPGHLAVIGRAKAACDRLIIGLNSDASTKRLKGPTRPIQNEQARAQVLAALEAVDLVVIFEENTPEKLVATIQPEIFVKGADYKVEDLPEAKIVHSYGGTVVLAELEPGQSTTNTVKKMTNG